MAYRIEADLRQVEEEYKNPEYRKTAVAIRAVMWPAVARGDFPEDVSFPGQEEYVYIHPDFEFYPFEGLIVAGEGKTRLTPTEARIFHHLTRRPNVAITRGAFLNDLNPESEFVPVGEKTVNAHISHIRRKIKSLRKEIEPIETVKGYGYRLVDPSRTNNHRQIHQSTEG